MPSSPLPSQTGLDDWRWLTNEAQRDWLAEVATWPGETLAISKRLRKLGLSRERVRLVLDQLTLRRSARRKFRYAERMFFARQLLEQATDERLATYKATRFPDDCPVIDICCGLGGDLMALANRPRVTGVDLDPRACLMAESNCHANGVTADFWVGPAEQATMTADSWVHLDPDRRASGKRTTAADFFSPNATWISHLLKTQQNVAIKLAPATTLPSAWPDCERQWLGDRRECKQQVAWFGETSPVPGSRSAAAIDQDGSVLFEWQEPASFRSAMIQAEVAGQLGPFLYEPHPTLIAGRMVDSLAHQQTLKRLAADVPYLTGGEVRHAALTGFEILESCRLEFQSVADAMQRHRGGALEIKKRGVDESLMRPFSRLKLSGDQSLVLMLTRLADRYLAVVCRRLDSPEAARSH